MKYVATKPWLYIITVLLISQSLYAATDSVPPPQLPNIDNLLPTLTTSPVSNVFLGTLIVEFERTTLGEIQKSADVGEIYHRGDEGGSQYWVCYTVPSNGQSERIWFSSGELGMPKHDIGSFYAVMGNTATKALSSCPELPARLRPVSLGNSLWLGTNLNQLKTLVGEPSAKGGWWFYSYTGKALTKDFDRLAILGVHVSNGKIVGLYESQVTTN